MRFSEKLGVRRQKTVKCNKDSRFIISHLLKVIVHNTGGFTSLNYTVCIEILDCSYARLKLSNIGEHR